MTVDYHKCGDRFLPAAERRELNIGDIYINAATCGECGDYIRSRNRHDYVTCSCGNVSVDGGSWYTRRSFRTGNYTDHVEAYADAVEMGAAS
jgi:hypothetical protein